MTFHCIQAIVNAELGYIFIFQWPVSGCKPHSRGLVARGCTFLLGNAQDTSVMSDPTQAMAQLICLCFAFYVSCIEASSVGVSPLLLVRQTGNEKWNDSKLDDPTGGFLGNAQVSHFRTIAAVSLDQPRMYPEDVVEAVRTSFRFNQNQRNSTKRSFRRSQVLP